MAAEAVMARRGGLALDGVPGSSARDIPGGGAAGPDRLAELVAEYERAMPR